MANIEFLKIPDISQDLLEKFINLAIDNRNTFYIIQVPISEISRIKIEGLVTPTKKFLNLHQLAITQIVSMFNFEYTRTLVSEQPIRFDIFISKIQKQPKFFLSNFLKRFAEWFGITLDYGIYNEWTKLKAHNSNEQKLPTPFCELFDKSLLLCVDGNVLIPLPILLSVIYSSRNLQPDECSIILNRIRQTLLLDIQNGSKLQFYKDISKKLNDPIPTLEDHKGSERKSRGELIDLLTFDESYEINELTIDGILYSLQVCYSDNPTLYKQKFNDLQGRLWESLLKSHLDLTSIEQSIANRSRICDENDWISSCRIVVEQLNKVSDAYTILTELEETLGVDRYLGSRVVSKDFDLIHKRVKKITANVQSILGNPLDIFLRKWNLTEVSKIILHLLNVKDEGKLKDYFPNDIERVIFIVVDALGYTQFRWMLNTVSRHVISPLSSNIFAWLINSGYCNEKHLLASNLISVTGGCLPTIYTGSLPKTSGIIGSHSLIGEYEFNFMKGDAGWGKSLLPKEAENIFYNNTNREVTPFADTAMKYGVNVTVVHGGQANFNPYTNLTYGKVAKDSKKMRKISQSERIFAEALEVINQWNDLSRRKELLLMYYPSIDSSGHPCGPYTQFQLSELSKLNFLFTHFLVELVRNNSELLDGKTAILITADHGMYESSSQIVSEKTIRKASQKLKEVKIVYENRACYLYGIPSGELGNVKDELTRFFKEENIPIKVLAKSDSLIEDLIFDPSSPFAGNCPDIILQFYAGGVFFHKENLEIHRFLYGAHGGQSVEELFVPLLFFKLTSELATEIQKFYD